jgi:MFS family permease
MSPAAAMSSSFDVVTFGETMVLFAPAERGTLEWAPAYHGSIGGAESNCAIGLARLGHSVCWVSRLGRDPFGSRVLKTLRGEGVDVSRVETDELAPTGIMLPTFATLGYGATALLIVLRLLQGLGAGAEQAGAAVLMMEYAPREKRGFFAALPFLGIQMGTILAALVYFVLLLQIQDVRQSWLWRVPFLASIVISAWQFTSACA